MKSKIITFLILLVIVLFSLLPEIHVPTSDLEGINEDELIHSSPSIQMYFYIKQYAEEYNIPEPYAFAIAFQETGYRGPLHLEYNHTQVSTSGALGPMQIMPSTAKLIEGRFVSYSELRNNIQLNVKISMKLLRDLKDRYGQWGLAFGAYNTGKPVVNQYAQNVLKKQFNWVEI